MLAALTLFEILAFAVFGLAVLIAVAFDRRGTPEPKWVVSIIGGVVLAGIFWNSWTFAGLWATISSLEFLKSLGFYLAIGLGYSLIEFGLEVRRSARYFAEAWESYLKKSTTFRDGSDRSEWKTLVNGEVLRKVKDGTPDVLLVAGALEVLSSFVTAYRQSNAIIVPTVSDGTYEIQPSVNRTVLAENIGAWTLWWPAYAVSLVLGDLLTEIFRTISDIIASLSGRAVKLAFKGVFKI